MNKRRNSTRPYDPNVVVPRPGRSGNKIEMINIHIKITIDQWEWLNKESERRGKLKGHKPQYANEAIREGIELLRQRDTMVFEIGGMLNI